jgi:hypothetical protein
MARLVFDSEIDSTPYDLDGQLTGWRAGPGYAAPTEGVRSPARAFDGSAGYTGLDESSALLGIRALTVRALVQPDFDAMDGLGPRAIAYRGSGGLTASEWWAWGVEVATGDFSSAPWSVVAFGNTAVPASRPLHWFFSWQQLQNVAPVRIYLAITEAPPPGVSQMVSVSYERGQDEVLVRLVIDGVLVAEVPYDVVIAATPNQPVTVGARYFNFGPMVTGYEQEFLGTMEEVTILAEATTPLQERHYHAELAMLPAALDTLRALWVQAGFGELLSGPNYLGYRLEPWARLLANFEAAALRREEALVPPLAYGDMLASWERAVERLPLPSETIAERQLAVATLLTDISGYSIPALLPFVARVFGVDVTEVAIDELRTDYEPVLVGAGDPVPLPWRVSGTASAALNPEGLALFGDEAERVYTPGQDGGALLVERSTGGYDSAMGWAVSLAVTQSVPTAYVAVTLRAGVELCTVAVVLDGGQWYLRVRCWRADVGGWTSWHTLGVLAGNDVDIALHERGGVWVARWREAGGTVYDWSEDAIPDTHLPTGTIGWAGVALVQEDDIETEATVTYVRLLLADAHPGYWAGRPTVTPPFPNLKREVDLLRRRNRAASLNGPTYEPLLLGGIDGCFAGYTLTVS